MPKKSIPAYCLHKATGQGYVKLDGKRHYLGVHGSKDSRTRYNRLIADWLSRRETVPKDFEDVTLSKLALLYMEHAKRRYRKNGEETSEVHIIQSALRFVVKRYRDLPASKFAPRSLKAVRQDMIDADLARSTVNALVTRIRRMYRWAIGEELVKDVNVLVALKAVPDLRIDGGEARETEAVKPVPDSLVGAVKPHVRPVVWAMIELQRVTGMRPGEVLVMRPSDLDTSGTIWEYRPHRHKNQHRRKERVIFIGPRGQAILREWLRPELEAYLFSPVKDGSRPYREDSYRNSIVRGCRRAGVDPWAPNQLRHSFGTEARREGGIEASRVTLGHSSLVPTQIYAEADAEAARAVVAKIG